MKKVIIYSDGSCIKYNGAGTGKGGYAAILKYKHQIKEVKGQIRETTNQRMELTAAIAGLSALKELCHVELYTDSMYLVQTMTAGWKRKANLDLWAILDKLAAKHHITWKHVKGHSGNELNERCNSLAQTEARKE